MVVSLVNSHSKLIFVKVSVGAPEAIFPSVFPVVGLTMLVLLLSISIAGVFILEEV